MSYRCPECDSDKIYVYISSLVLLEQDEHGVVGHGPVEHLYWDNDSLAECASCHSISRLGSLEADEEDA